MFLQIHSLTSYHASLLNRDDAGLAKRIPFGDATRLRVSSQCLKRHWREALRNYLSFPHADQTRKFFLEIDKRLREEKKVPIELAQALATELKVLLITKSVEGLNESDETKTSESTDLGMDQPSIFGRPEQDYLVSLALKCAQKSGQQWASQSEAINRLWVELTGKEKPAKPKKRSESEKAKLRENFKTMLRTAGQGDLFAGLEGALFGRFVTSDILSRSDAPVHVAHAFTVHGLETEVDYFTAIEELAEEGETGAAHAGDMELGAGLFYGYVAVDVPLLVSNFTGCDRKDWTKQDLRNVRAVLDALIRAIATVSPGAKLGATAPYAYSEFLLLETGKQQPRSLANAYLQALRLKGDGMQQAIKTLADHLGELEGMYGQTSQARIAATTRTFDGKLGDEPVETQSLAKATDSILKAIFGSNGNANADSTL